MSEAQDANIVVRIMQHASRTSLQGVSIPMCEQVYPSFPMGVPDSSRMPLSKYLTQDSSKLTMA